MVFILSIVRFIWEIQSRTRVYTRKIVYVCVQDEVRLIGKFPYGFERSKELLLGESPKLTLCARSAKESKINNQFISPHNTRYSNQQYARFT